MNHIGLFEGIGGFSLAARQMGWQTIAWCEINEFCQKVLKYHFPNAKGHSDITKTDFSIYRGHCDILTGGFPCQDASNAKQNGGSKGLDGYRTGLWWHMVRAIGEIKPKYVVAENVSNILKVNGGRDFGKILTSLAGMGYNAEWRVCRASEKGAPHHRARLYLVAYPDNIRTHEGKTFIPYVSEKNASQPWRFNGATVPIVRSGSWLSEPPVPVLVDVLPTGLAGITVSKHRNESIKAYGNAVVPELVMQIYKAIEQYEQRHHQL